MSIVEHYEFKLQRLLFGDKYKPSGEFYTGLTQLLSDMKLIIELEEAQLSYKGKYITSISCLKAESHIDNDTEITIYTTKLNIIDNENYQHSYNIRWWEGKDSNIRFYTRKEILDRKNYKPCVLNKLRYTYSAKEYNNIPVKNGFLFMNKIFIPYYENNSFFISSINLILQQPNMVSEFVLIESNVEIDKIITLNEEKTRIYIQECGYVKDGKRMCFNIIIKGEKNIYS